MDIEKGGLQHEIQCQIKKIIGVPKHSSTNYLYADRSKAGLGLTSVKTEYSIQSIVGAFRMLKSRNKEVSKVLQLDLRKAVMIHEKGTNPATLEEAFNWINKGDSGKGFINWWTKIRLSIHHLKNELGITVLFILNKEDITISLNLNTNKGYSITFKRSNNKQLCEWLHLFAAEANFHKWIKQVSAGQMEEALGSFPLTSKLLWDTS